MKYEIPQEIIDVTTECPRDLGCLVDGKCKNLPMCEADYAGREYNTFLQSGVSQEVLQQCRFVFPSYGKLICKCPVRYYLCKEYGV